MSRLTDLEWYVLDALWSGGPMELGRVVDALAGQTGWSRNTVHTYLTRMAAKGLVTIDRERTPHMYSAALDREACAAEERRGLLDRVYQGSAGKLVTAFVRDGTLSAEEREALRALLDEMEV